MSESGIVELVVMLLVVSGTVMTLISTFGIFRLPDVYTKAHAATKSSTLGILTILLGAFLYFIFKHQIVSIRLLLGIAFVFLTAPVAGHIIIRSAHRRGEPLADISVGDALRELKLEMAGEGAEVAEEAAGTARAAGAAGTAGTAGAVGTAETARAAEVNAAERTAERPAGTGEEAAGAAKAAEGTADAATGAAKAAEGAPDAAAGAPGTADGMAEGKGNGRSEA